MHWLPGSLVVFEGLDRTGKSKQIVKLLELPWDRPPALAHMPTGVANSTRDIYGVTELRKADDPLGAQLLHLAAHVFNMPALLELRQRQGLLMDRCGWSPLAYGAFGAGMEHAGVTPDLFVALAEGIWSRLQPDVVFLLDHPLEEDEANTEAVRRSYGQLAERAGDVCVRLGHGSVEQIHAHVMDELRGRGFVVC